MTAVSALERSVVVDIGLELHRSAPPSGHVEPIQVAGLLRHVTRVGAVVAMIGAP